MSFTTDRESWSSTQSRAGSQKEWKKRVIDEIPQYLFSHPTLSNIVKKVASNRRLSFEDGLQLFHESDLNSIAILADSVKRARFGSAVFFNNNLHINQTNVCVLACRFCAFRRGPQATDAYSLDVENFLTRIEPYAQIIDEIHTVGGLHPNWDVSYYENLFSMVKKHYPAISIKALSAVEIKHLSEQSNLPIKELLLRLQQSGLDALPGGGAEILDDSIRDIICNGKETSAEYLEIHRIAHELGIPTNCTMLFGTIENVEHRIIHLEKLRLLQDETGGFQCFVPYPFLPDHSRLPEAQLATSSEILRVIAISRLMLDNIPHIKAYRMNIGDSLAQLALTHGANDIDGTVGHEEIMHSAGSSTPLENTADEVARLIEDTESIPFQRNTNYTRFNRHHRPPPPNGGSRLPVIV